MKFSCTQNDLAEALNIVSRAIAQNNTLPVLNNILIKAESDKVYLSSTNLEVAITTYIDAKVDKEGSYTVPAKLLTSYIHYLKDCNILVQLKENEGVILKSPGSNTVIKGISSDEFPSIPKVEDGVLLTVNKEHLTECIDQVVFAAATTSVRPVLSGVYFDVKKKSLTLVATDSYRLSERSIDLEKEVNEELDAIIPSKTIFELGKVLPGVKSEEVEIRITKNQVLFCASNITLISRLIDGQFPDYKQIIPKSSKTKGIVKIADLELCLKRINLFAKENNHNVKLNFLKDGKLNITTQATQYGREEDEIDISIEGEDNVVALNSSFLLDALSSVKGEDVSMEIDTSLSPVLIKDPKQKDYTHIIMTLKL